MIHSNCNGNVMFSSESDVVKNSIVYSELEKYLKGLSSKYGLGEVLFREKNPKNNNSTDSFYIRAPKEWSNEKIFKIWDCIIEEAHSFLESKGYEGEMGICGIVVSSRY